MRCLALGSALRKRRCNIYFVMRDFPDNNVELVTRAGFNVKLISNSKYNKDAELTDYDQEMTAEIAQRVGAYCILVDNYGATTKYLRNLKSKGIRVAVIDDLADRDLSAADWILNQNIATTEMVYRASPDCIQLVGQQYVLLRPEFFLARTQQMRHFASNDTHILITLGGGNTAELTKNLIDSLESVVRTLEIRCIVCETDDKLKELRNNVNRSHHLIEIIGSTDDMVKEMLWSSLSINAGGSTCWELMCLGVPMIVIALSSDQYSNAESLEEIGCAKQLNVENIFTLPFIVEYMLKEHKLRSTMSEIGMSMVDGKGAARVAESLIQMITDRKIRGFSGTY